MISEESCDTEDWSNDAENSDFITGINYILKDSQIENGCFKFAIWLILPYIWLNKFSLSETFFKAYQFQ